MMKIGEGHAVQTSCPLGGSGLSAQLTNLV